METLQTRKFTAILLKVLYLMLPAIISFLMLYPGIIFASDNTNIVLPGGKSPKLNIQLSNSTEYISLKEYKNTFLSNYNYLEKYILESNGQFIIFNPSSFFICTIYNDNQYIVQLNAPTYEADGELFIPISNLLNNLEALKLYKSFKEEDISYLKKFPEASTDEKIIIKDFDFSDNIQEFKFEGNPLEEANATDIESSNIEIIDTEKEERSKNIISGESRAEHIYNDNKVLTVSAIFKNNLQASKDAFLALEPSKNHIIYLEPVISVPKYMKKDEKKEVPNNFPPNVYVVPKGLIRRGIDKN